MQILCLIDWRNNLGINWNIRRTYTFHSWRLNFHLCFKNLNISTVIPVPSISPGNAIFSAFIFSKAIYKSTGTLPLEGAWLSHERMRLRREKTRIEFETFDSKSPVLFCWSNFFLETDWKRTFYHFTEKEVGSSEITTEILILWKWKNENHQIALPWYFWWPILHYASSFDKSIEKYSPNII